MTMETKSMFKSLTRRSSISEREKRSKKSNKKRKKSKRGILSESDKLANGPQEVTQGGFDTDRGKEAVSLSHATIDPQQHPKVSPLSSPNGVSGSLSPTESPSVNTDLSESTISLISTNGNSQTDIREQTPTLTSYSSNAVVFTESLSVCNVKSKTQAAQTGRSRSVAAKPQQRCLGSNGIRKTSTFNKSKSSNAFLQNTKSCAKLKTLKDSEAKMDAEPVDKTSEKSEALRWEFSVEDLDKEEERINMYKINRRKRYLAAAQAKGLAWASEYNETGNPASLQKDITYANETGEITVQQCASGFISVQSLVPATVHTVEKKIFVDC
ncbi:uncharacterized protein LOC135476836 [Liolophura sinensis]|uniref:uncharacterized protein LOC135476836 n=1 Tax=Liolophura sinensis TaxID=3198878 RepID=UPI0031591076